MPFRFRPSEISCASFRLLTWSSFAYTGSFHPDSICFIIRVQRAHTMVCSTGLTSARCFTCRLPGATFIERPSQRRRALQQLNLGDATAVPGCSKNSKQNRYEYGALLRLPFWGFRLLSLPQHLACDSGMSSWSLFYVLRVTAVNNH